MIAALLLALGVVLGPRGAPAAADSTHGSVVTDTLWSQALGVKKAVIVYVPPSYATAPARRYPVAYYLHGLTGSEVNWTKGGHLNEVMDSLVAAGGPEMIVIMPDGDDGWYTTWNSLVTMEACRRTAPARESAETYCVPWQHYDDYIAHDVVQFADRKYRTRADRQHRAIAGLSMGGYGAVALALEYPEVFAAAASHSGVLAPLYTGPSPFDGHPQWAQDGAALEKAWGRLWPLVAPVFGRDTAAWWSRDPGRRLARLVGKSGTASVPALFADCGTEDGLVNQNRAFKWIADQQGVPIVYHEWPGKHEMVYWRAHVGESLYWIGTIIAR
jgi:S-formylglutathione hydrolase FrmB